MGVVIGKQSAESMLLQVVDEHGGGIECMAVSDDLSVLATGSQDNTVRLWSIRGEECEGLHVLRGHYARITSVVFSEESVLSASVDKTIRRWDVLTGHCVFVCNGHLAQVNRILCTGDFIFSASYDRTARCWDMDTGECLRIFRGHQRGLFSLMYVPIDDDDDDNEQNGNKNDEVVAGSRDLLITVSGDGTARSWSLETAHTVRVFSGHTSSVTCVATDSDGQTLFTGSMDMTVRSWVLQSGRPLFVFKGHEGPVLHIAVVNKTLYSASSDATARAWLKDLGEPLQVYKGHTRSVARLCVHQSVVYTASGDSFIHSYDARSGTLKNKFAGHEYAVNCIVVVGDKLYSASDDGTVRVWSLNAPVDHGKNGLTSATKSAQWRRSSSCPPSAKSKSLTGTPQRRPASVQETIIN